MATLRFTLLSDGSSDQVLIPILHWLLGRHGVTEPIQSLWADFRRLRHPPQGLSERIRVAIELFPCDLLFIHRDAERVRLATRKDELLTVLRELPELKLPAVCVIPVRMQEAWLLIDEAAIRHAAGNRSGRESLSMPRIQDLEGIPDPKEVLHDLLRQASGLRGHRLRRLSVQAAAHLVVAHIQDFSPLLRLRAFQELDTDLRQTAAGFHTYISGS